MRRRISALLSVGLLSAGLLAACGNDTTDAPATGTTTSEEAAATDDATTSTPAMPQAPARAAEIATADTDLGTILVDGNGITLYLFTNDSPGESVCLDECLEAWPVFEGEPAAGEGVDAALLGTIDRDDGTVQATYADWPLYYFAQDVAPGDVTGQGVNDVWFVIAPDGTMITERPGAESRPGPGY